MTGPTSDAAARASAWQLGWAAIAVLIGGAPHLLLVAPWITALLAGACVWRITAALRGWGLVSIWLRVPLTFFAFAGVVMTYRSVSGVDAGSALLLVMAAMKLLETRSVRDRVLLAFIGYFLLFTVFLREQPIWSLAWLAAGTLGITAALARTVRHGPPPPAAASVRLAGRLLLQALPLAVVLFVLFPRVPGPFWALPKPTGGMSGLTEEMQPGDITALSLSDEVAFRVRFDGEPPPAAELYWRGPVLDRFDGRRWTTASQPGRLALPAAGSGRPHGYELVLEPHGQRWLLALETPVRWTLPRAQLTANLQLLSGEPATERLSYRARSVIGGIAATAEGAAVLERARLLPGGRNPRARALAAEMRSQSASAGAYLQRLLEYFRTEPFSYTLNPPALGSESVDEFLFVSRRGFCEHYASAFAVLARAADIPARVVLGYQGAERNPISDYWIVRQANAHAWVEVWLDGGWRRVDPTAAVAPERIENGVEQAFADSPRMAGRLWRSNAALNRLVLSWDAFNAAWDRWVLAFGPESQTDLLMALGFAMPEPMQLAALAGSATAVCLLLLALALRPSRRPGSDPAARLYAKLCHRLARAVRPRAAAEGPAAYAQAISALRPDLADPVTAMTNLYLRLRYDGGDDPRLRQELAAALRRFRPQPVHAPA